MIAFTDADSRVEKEWWAAQLRQACDLVSGVRQLNT